MTLPRFLFVPGAGFGVHAHPTWPDVHLPFHGEPDCDGSWVAWRLTGANHRELGRSAGVFPDLGRARANAYYMRDRITEAQPQILTVPHTTTWGWLLHLNGSGVATSSRGYARHRECAYSAAAFVRAVVIADLTGGEMPHTRDLDSAPAGGATGAVAN